MPGSSLRKLPDQTVAAAKGLSVIERLSVDRMVGVSSEPWIHLPL